MGDMASDQMAMAKARGDIIRESGRPELRGSMMELTTLLDALEQAIDNNGQIASRLENRISPILKTVPGEAMKDSSDSYAMSPLGGRIERLTSTLYQTNQNLNSLIEAVDL